MQISTLDKGHRGNGCIGGSLGTGSIGTGPRCPTAINSGSPRIGSSRSRCLCEMGGHVGNGTLRTGPQSTMVIGGTQAIVIIGSFHLEASSSIDAKGRWVIDLDGRIVGQLVGFVKLKSCRGSINHNRSRTGIRFLELTVITGNCIEI